MNVIKEAKASRNRIRNNGDLLAMQKEMLETMLQHHAISEAEYQKSLRYCLSKSMKSSLRV